MVTLEKLDNAKVCFKTTSSYNYTIENITNS